MKTPDKNKCGLECIRTNVERVCVKPEKGQCPRCEQLVGESLDHIQQLEASYSQVSKALCGKENATLDEVLQAISQVKAELKAVKQERNALLADLCMLAIKRIPCDMCRNDHRNDPICKSHQGDCSECSLHCPCDGCFDEWEMEFTGANFQWRGICPENTEVQDDD